MPKMDGLTLLKKVRETNKSTPIIMVTTEAEKSRIVEAIKVGASNYMIKPFKTDILLDKIRETYDKSRTNSLIAWHKNVMLTGH